jgi:hypothetical protein
MTDHAFDAIALSIEAPVPAWRMAMVGARRDYRADAPCLEIGANHSAVIALVTE